MSTFSLFRSGLLLSLLAFCSSSELNHAACPRDAWVDGLPLVQCDRNPPCVRWNWATPARCAQMQLDSHWPTWDPYIKRDYTWTNMRKFLHEHVQGKTLLFVGDSITNLWYHGFICEAARHGLTVSTGGKRLSDFVAAFSAIPESDWVEKGAPHQYVHVVETDTIIAHKGWAKSSPTDTAAFLSIADVVLVNYGLHYHDQLEFESSMEDVFSQMHNFNSKPGKFAVFREISAQAFDKTGSWTTGADKTTQCAATPPNVAYDNIVWRQNQLLWKLAHKHQVPMLPFYNLTIPRWNMREEKFCEFEGRRNNPEMECTDCTHLCVTPTLWASQVSALDDIVALV